MKINIEKFICDCIEKAERSVTWEYIDENIDGHIFKGALREQGLEYKNGKIVKIGEEPKEVEKDKELTWDDIRIILDAENDIIRECNSQKKLVIVTYPKGEDYYGEIFR